MLNSWMENNGWKEDKPNIIDGIQLNTVEFCSSFFLAFRMQNAQPEETLSWAISSDLINHAGHKTFLIGLIIAWAWKKPQTNKHCPPKKTQKNPHNKAQKTNKPPQTPEDIPSLLKRFQWLTCYPVIFLTL